MLIPSIIIFVITYILMFAFQKFRPYIAITSAIVFIVLGYITQEFGLKEMFTQYIDFNVLLMITGTMITVSLMIDSKMPSLMADLLIEKVPNILWATVVLSLFSGIVSAFIDNVATVLMVAPIALELAKKKNINPIGMIIAIAVSSNLQGAATLVGDTTSILLGGYANMNFLDFFFIEGKPSIFFATELGALVSASLLFVIFRKEKQSIEAGERTVVTDYVPSILLLLTVLTLIVASFFNIEFSLLNGTICMSIAIIGLVYVIIKNKTFKAAVKPIKDIDFQTLLLLFGLFMVIGGITEFGVIDSIAELFKKMSGGNLFLMYTIIVWLSVAFSAFIDNIPYVATMLPVVKMIGLSFGLTNPLLLYFGLLCGATLGGNLTPIGASANITALGLLRKEGYEVKNSDFLKIGIPFTLAAIIPAYIFIWFVFKP